LPWAERAAIMCGLFLTLVQAVGLLLRSKRCEVASTDLRVWIPASGLYTYPDVVVTCGAENFQDDHFDVLLNPMLIIEVLSPSAEDYDRGHKFCGVSKIPSMRENLTVAQDRCFVEQWIKRESTEWMPVSFTNSNATVPLDSIGVAPALAYVYRNIV